MQKLSASIRAMKWVLGILMTLFLGTLGLMVFTLNSAHAAEEKVSAQEVTIGKIANDVEWIKKTLDAIDKKLK